MRYIKISLPIFSTSNISYQTNDLLLLRSNDDTNDVLVCRVLNHLMREDIEHTFSDERIISVQMPDGSYQYINEDDENIFGLGRPDKINNRKVIPVSEVEELLLVKRNSIKTGQIVFDKEKALSGIKDISEFDNKLDYVKHFYHSLNDKFFDGKLIDPSFFSISPSAIPYNNVLGFWTTTLKVKIKDNIFVNPTILFIHPSVLEESSKEELCYVLLHEMCHEYVTINFPNADVREFGHGHEWRQEMMDIGMDPNADRYNESLRWYNENKDNSDENLMDNEANDKLQRTTMSKLQINNPYLILNNGKFEKCKLIRIVKNDVVPGLFFLTYKYDIIGTTSCENVRVPSQDEADNINIIIDKHDIQKAHQRIDNDIRFKYTYMKLLPSWIVVFYKLIEQDNRFKEYKETEEYKSIMNTIKKEEFNKKMEDALGSVFGNLNLLKNPLRKVINECTKIRHKIYDDNISNKEKDILLKKLAKFEREERKKARKIMGIKYVPISI